MPGTMIEKILSSHSGRDLKPGDIADIEIDARVARDFGGANVVKNLKNNGLGIADADKTFFTFDCNPTGSDQKYATNQQACRMFARDNNIRVFDIDNGIGTHTAIDDALVLPGGTIISTDSHANILGAIGAFGQGMGDRDIAAAWASGRIWFKVPQSAKIVLKGMPGPDVLPKDVVLFLLQQLGAAGLLGYAAELYGEYVDQLPLSGRITMASMATEMAGIIALFPPNKAVMDHFKTVTGKDIDPVLSDADAVYGKEFEFDISGITPMVSRPGHPEDVISVHEAAGKKIDSGFIGSCTNGRFDDMKAAAEILKGRHVAPGVVLKIVPATRKVWQQCLDEGIIEIFMNAGALVGNAGCAGCAAGQIGQNGPGEVTISTGNRNFAGKQGKGEVYLASPATVAASAVAGIITSSSNIPDEPVRFTAGKAVQHKKTERKKAESSEKPVQVSGRVWVVSKDNIDTDMIYHNRYLSITDIAEMGQYAFDNLEGWKDFAKKAKKGDIIITGNNFGAGSSRQQAVDCFASLGVSLIIAQSFGSIYERNAVNSGFPILVCDLSGRGIENGEEIAADFTTGVITRKSTGETFSAQPFSEVQMDIYQKGGLLK